MLDAIKDLLKRAWNFLKKIFVKVVSFVKNIFSFFKAKYYSILKKHPNAKAVSIKIKNDLENGNYNTVNLNDEIIVNTFYDEDTGSIIENETEIISYESLDEQTKAQFGNKDMLVIEN